MDIPRIALALIALPLLGACATVPRGDVGPDHVALGQTANLGGPRVTPLKVLEDSRCPMEARCVWAGRVRLKVRIALGSGSELREIASDKPIQVGDGTLELAGVMPPRSVQRTIAPRDYRFSFRFAGGI